MTDSRTLLAEIDAFLAAKGMAPSTFGMKVLNNSKLIDRLRAGGSVRLETAEKIREFIGPPAKRKRRAA